MAKIRFTVWTGPTFTTFDREHTGRELLDLIEELKRDGISHRLRPGEGVWRPFHAITKIVWKVLR